MTKIEYMKPTMEIIEADIEQQILAGSVDTYNINKSLQDNEVEEAWARRNSGFGVWDDDWSE